MEGLNHMQGILRRFRYADLCKKRHLRFATDKALKTGEYQMKSMKGRKGGRFVFEMIGDLKRQDLKSRGSKTTGI